MINDQAKQKESIALMKRVAQRNLFAEKMAWTTMYMLEKRPKAERTIRDLSEELHAYMADTVAMVKTIPYMQAVERKLDGDRVV